MNTKFSRRDFFKVFKYLGIGALAASAGPFYIQQIEPSWLDVSHVDVSLVSLPKAFNGYRIAQISDIHIGAWMNRERLANVVKQVLEQKPDLVVATGDFMFGHFWDDSVSKAASDFIDVMKPLAEVHHVIAVLGNHDHWTNAERTREMLSLSGILELNNDILVLNSGDEQLFIAGVDDVMVGAHNLEAVLAKLPSDAHTILLAHEPDFADIAGQTGKFLLQLSGHSHGGQVVIPFSDPLVLPDWGRKYPSGLYNVLGMWLYTNRGVGMTEPFVRFNCRPEITVFTLRGPG